MKTSLNLTQIKHLSRLIEMKGVNYHDVNMELTDHMACEVEKLIEETGVEYMKAVKKVFLRYDRFHFMRIEDKKIKELEKKSWKAVWKELISFFNIPKIIITLLVFIVFSTLLKYINMNHLVVIISGIAMIIATVILFKKRKILGENRYLQLRSFSLIFILFIQIPLQFGISTSISEIFNVSAEHIYIKSGFLTLLLLISIILYQLYTNQLNKLKAAYA